MYKDAIDTASDSGDAEVVDSLLRFFIQIEDKESFCATLYTCYSLVSPGGSRVSFFFSFSFLLSLANDILLALSSLSLYRSTLPADLASI